VMDPMLVCKKTRRLKGKLADICRKEPSLLKEIAKGIQVGTRECQYQFRNRRWNCTTVRRSLKKILLRGELLRFARISDEIGFRGETWKIQIQSVIAVSPSETDSNGILSSFDGLNRRR